MNSNDKISWKIEKETKKIGNTLLQKATTHFGGRFWIAWFEAKIPFSEGPYKFTGLSGLIYEIHDQEAIFHYTLVKNKNLPKSQDTTDFLETNYGKKPIKITLNQYHQLKLNYYHNIVEILKEFAKKGGSIASDLDLSTSEEIEKRRKTLQQSIKEIYMPIEKDKAIPYPDF